MDAVMQWCFTQWAPMPEKKLHAWGCAFLIFFLLAWDFSALCRNYCCWRCHLPWLQPSMTFLWIPSHWNTEFAFEFEIVRISRETEQSNAPMTGEVEQLLQSTQSTPLAKTNGSPCQGAGRYCQPQWANAHISGVKPCSVSTKVRTASSATIPPELELNDSTLCSSCHAVAPLKMLQLDRLTNYNVLLWRAFLVFPEICLILRFGKKFLWDANAPCFLSSTVKVEKNKFAAQGQVLTQLRRGLLQRFQHSI